MNQNEREAGARLSVALKNLHRALIRAEAGDDPDLQNPYTLLFAVIGDPRFGWMSGLSKLIVQLDEMLDDDEAAAAGTLAPFRVATEALLGEGESEQAEFRLRYLLLLQKDADVALATGALRRAVASIRQAGTA